jgi:hypothetical protein
VRSVIAFYTLYLATVMPIVWLPDEAKAKGILVVSVVEAALVLAWWKWSGVSLGPRLTLDRAAVAGSVAGLVLLAPLLGLNFLYHRSLQAWFGVEPERFSDVFRDAGYGIAVVVLAVCVMPAIWEELAFRGIVQGELAKAVRGGEAVVMTAVLFSVIHVSVFSAPYLLALGLFLGLLRERSGSLVPGMAVHFAHNLAVMLIERPAP